ncbi:MAG: hypothetical protein P1V51_17900 [Deltaproteobacteria bacterium]|nr:hypothetical protein [Deltaproteobacteria bacterium]
MKAPATSTIASTVLPLLCAAALVGTSAWLADRMQGEEDGEDPPDRIVYLPPAWALRAGSFGHPQLAADYIWLGALQYYGSWSNRKLDYRDLHRYIDRINEVDPDFQEAYRFGATSVPYHRGNWYWANRDAARAIAERGVERFPDDWRLWLQYTFILGIIGDEPEKAAEAAAIASRIPDSPHWVTLLTTRFFSTAGQLDKATEFARLMLENTENQQEREALERRLVELETERIRREIDEAISRFIQREQRAPATIEALVEAGDLPGIPHDPLGGTFEIDEKGQAVASSLHKGKLQIFDQDQRSAPWK